MGVKCSVTYNSDTSNQNLHAQQGLRAKSNTNPYILTYFTIIIFFSNENIRNLYLKKKHSKSKKIFYSYFFLTNLTEYEKKYIIFNKFDTFRYDYWQNVYDIDT